MLLWGGFAFWVVVASLISGDIYQAAMWFGQALFATFLGLAFSHFSKIWAYLAFAVLVVLVTSLSIHGWAQARQWQFAWGASDSVDQRGYLERGWTVIGADTLSLELTSALEKGVTGVSWNRSSRDIKYTRTDLGQAKFVFPSHNREFIYRAFRDGSPISGRNFRVKISLRTGPTNGGVLSLSAAPVGPSSSLSIKETSESREFEIDWRVPNDFDSKELRITLAGFNSSEVWINNLTVEEEVGGNWLPLKNLGPVGIGMQILDGSSLVAEQRIVPQEQASTTVLASSSHFRWFRNVRVQLRTEPGAKFRLEKSNLVANGLVIPWTKKRQDIFTNHPNLEGHTIGLFGATTLLLPVPFSAVGALIAVFGVGLTASRTAWIMLNFALVFWALMRLPRRWTFLVILVLFMVNAGLYYIPASGIDRLGLASVEVQQRELDSAISSNHPGHMSRPEIWGYALTSILKNPLLGTSQPFDSMLEDEVVEQRSYYPRHAHNFVLQMAFRHGIFGVIAALWVVVGILIIGFRWGGVWGLTYALLPMILNIPDFTLFFVGVLVPMTLGLNFMRSERD